MTLAPYLLLLSAHPSINLKPTHKNLKSIKKGVWEANAQFTIFPGGTAVIKLANKGIETEVRRQYNEFLKFAREPRFAGAPKQTWELDLMTEVATESPNLISVFIQTYDYSGGAHPNTLYKTLNYGLAGGKPRKINLNDIATDPKALVLGPVLMKLNAIKKERDVEAATEIEKPYFSSFVVTKAGMTWIFQPYAVGAYVEGEYEVKLTWNELRPYLRAGSPVSAIAR